MELWKNAKESPFRKGALLLLDVSFFINDSMHLLHTVGSLYSITPDNEFVVISYVPSVCLKQYVEYSPTKSRRSSKST